MIRVPARLLALAPLLAASTLLHGQSEWPQFRGPTGQGIAERGPASWGMEKGVAWKVAIK